MKTRFITTLALAICISTSYSAQVKKKVTVKKSKVEAVNKDSVEHAALEEKALSFCFKFSTDVDL